MDREAIEERIDKMTSGIQALLALEARWSIQKEKPTAFIKSFSESLGITDDKSQYAIAIITMEYLYPPNPDFWKKFDRMYKAKYEKSIVCQLAKIK